MSSALPFGDYITLSNGNRIPQLGFGVYMMSGSECSRSVTTALEAGYRHIDSAEWYNNERQCSEAITAFLATRPDLSRSDIFYTSKLQSNSDYAHARKSLEASLRRAQGLGHIDLYLIHSPYPSRKARLESWKALVDARDAGLVRNIGVSNYGPRHLREIEEASMETPAVNQIDLHPFMTRVEEMEYCVEKGIKVEAWGPLVRGIKMSDGTLRGLARKYGKSVAQVLIRYSLQRGCISIPKSSTKSRIVENTKVFDFALTDQEMETLNGLNEDLVTDWDPIGDSSV